MSHSRLVFVAVSGVLVLSILSGTLFGASALDGEAEEGSIYKYLSVFTEVLRLVRQAYVDETDVRTLMHGAFEGAPDALDPFSMYVPEEGIESFVAAREVGSRRSGIRIVKERGVAYVVAVQDEGPAAEIGIQRGDIVAEMDGLSTRGLPLWRIEEQLAAEVGTEIELEILRAGETRDLVLELSDFSPPLASLEQVEGTPLLRIASFAPEAVAKIRGLLEGVVGSKMLIDVRGVAWGDTESAYDVAKLFASGELGSLVNRHGRLQTFKADGAATWLGSLVLLVDRGAQGPAEVFAKVLQQSSGAKLVGQPTFGHAGRSRVVELNAGGSLVITEAFYTGPDGEPLNEAVEPDLMVGNRSRSFKELDESLEDLTLQRGLELLLSDQSEVKKAA